MGIGILKTPKYAQWFIRLLDFFVPAQFKTDVHQHTRSRVLVGVVLLNVMTCIFTGIAIEAWFSLNTQNFILAYSVIAQCMLLYMAALFVLRIWGAFMVAGNLAAFSVFVTILGSAIVTGGYRDSPFTMMFVLVPVLVFLLVGLRSGIVWSAMTIAALFGLLFADQVMDFHYQLLRKADITTFRRILPFVMASMIVFALIVYELMNESLKRQINRERNRFAFKASHDSLTDLPNRNEFYQRLRRGIEDTEMNNNALALVYIDLDGFKPINDTYGHHAGDKVLKVIASRLRSIVRQHDTVARLGGDEFALILPGIAQQNDVLPIVEKTLAVIGEPIEIDGNFVIVHCSAGIALCPQHSRDHDRLCRLADQAMYQAKIVKNSYCFSDAPSNSLGEVAA